ncbi:MAG: GAF domain-containing sensor histidine kinase, partial [Chitinophagia bacterium]|nr:GAF domain-containing sensor histidine kinase [Chitinophagia bacterium]
MPNAGIPKDELSRIAMLAELDIDYADIDGAFKNLTRLAAKVSGSPISLLNLIDNYTVWTVSRWGFDVEQTPREESMCQFTILEPEHYTVEDFTASDLFKHQPFVTGEPHFRFYCGVPLRYKNHNIGTLCVLDHSAKKLTPEAIETLRIIGEEVINRLSIHHYIKSLLDKVTEVEHKQMNVLHDIRGPISGIIGLADIIVMEGKDNNLNEVLEFAELMRKGGKSVIDLADEILAEIKQKETHRQDKIILGAFKERLVALFQPQALHKDVALVFNMGDIQTPVPRPQLLQIAGN